MGEFTAAVARAPQDEGDSPAQRAAVEADTRGLFEIGLKAANASPASGEPKQPATSPLDPNMASRTHGLIMTP